MAVVQNIVKKYDSASVVKRVEYILDNYAVFCSIIDGYESDLIIDIIDERSYVRKLQIGDTGVRVQTSNISDITFNLAAEHDEVVRAVKGYDYFTALKGINDTVPYIRTMETLKQMRIDYETVSTRIKFLQPKEYQLYSQYLSKKKTVDILAEEIGISYDAYKSRIYRCRSIVKQLSVEAIGGRNSRDKIAA